MKKINIQLFGIPGLAYYGYKDLGSAIEGVEKYTAKIKTNKYTMKDLTELSNAVNAVIKFVEENENKN